MNNKNKKKKPNTPNNKMSKNQNTKKVSTNKIKKKIDPKKSKKPGYGAPSTKPIKARMERKETKEDKNTKIACLVSLVLIVVIIYITLGWLFGLLTAIGFGLIIGVSKLLKKCKGKKSGKVLKILLIICLIFAIVGVSVFGAFMLYIKKEADPIYDLSKLETPENTTFLDKYDVEYAKLGSEIRQKVTYEQLPQVLIDALVATEDSRFFQHNGLDAPRLIKATIGQIIGKSDAGGASTITMQVIKNSLTDPYATKGVNGIVRKLKDIYLSIFKLEKECTKEKIIEYYVNNHYLGGNVYGVQEASEAYFGKDVSELTLSEAAIIAGMFKSPLYYRPTVYPEHAQERRATVLYLMRRHGYITKEEEEIANSIPVESLTDTREDTNQAKYMGYIDTVVAEIRDKYDINAYTTPLLVHTNLDPARQDAVNGVFNGETYDWINDKVQAGASVIENATGKILAIGNGRNINGRSATGKNQTNYATGINRQPGSTAKPLFDYGPGIEYNNWSTYTLFDDAPYQYSDGRSIKNWDNGYFGTITMRRALSTSRNIPALKAFQQVNNNQIKEFVVNLGLTPEVCSSGYSYDKTADICVNVEDKTDTKQPAKLHEAHSIGAFSGTNPLEMSAAYAAFGNGGTYHEPYSVSKIVFKSTGEEIVHEDVSKKAMSDATAFMISSILQNVALNGGTPQNVACKTGTTNYDSYTMEKNNLPSDAIRDSWVVGYSTKTTIALWYGYDYIDSEYCLHNIPATIQKDKIFRALVNSGAMESNREAFTQPDSVTKVGIVAGSNPPMKAGSYTGEIVYEYFKKGYEPELTYEDTKLDKPKNLTAKYNKITKKVTLSWEKVDPKNTANQNYGTFGYNIYFNNTLIDFTEKTTYTHTPSGSPYGTYKVVAAYKGYSGIQGETATYELKEEAKVKLSLAYTGTTTMKKDTPLVLDLSKFTVKDNNKTVTATITTCTPIQITEPGKTKVTCTITYKEKDYEVETYIDVILEDSEEKEE